MSATRAAKVIFVPMKSCFVAVPRAWADLLQGEEPAVLEIRFRKKKKAYLSWAGDFVSTSSSGDEDIIQLDGLYGTKLNLSQDEEVMVRILERRTFPCEKAFLEPLSVDDWEIFEMNSSFIESNLMNQIRVIWKDQVFPIWVQKNVCIFVRIMNIVPYDEPLLLVQNTEVVVKSRAPSSLPGLDKSDDESDESPEPPDVSAFPKRCSIAISKARRGVGAGAGDSAAGGSGSRKFKKRGGTSKRSDELDDVVPELGRRDSILGMFSYVSDFMWSMWGQNQQVGEEEDDVAHKEIDAFVGGICLKFPVSLVYRVVPVPPQTIKFNNTKSSNLITDSFTVYIMSSRLPEELRGHGHFFAAIRKILSPSERIEEQKKQNQSSAGSPTDEKLKSSHSSSHKSKSKKAHPNEKHCKPSDDCIVQVVVTDLNDDSDAPSMDLQLNLVPNSVAVPDQLRRKLGLETTCLVCLEVLMNPLKPVTSLELCPISSLPSDCDEADVVSAFKDALRVTLKQSPAILVSPGMLMTLQIGKADDTDFLLFPNASEPVSPTRKDPGSSDRIGPIGFYLSGLDVYADAVDFTVEQLSSTEKPWYLRDFRSLQDIDLPIPGVRLEALGGVNGIAEKCVSFVKLTLGLGPLPACLSNSASVHGGLMICGSKGCGKSTLVKAISRTFMQAPYHVYIHGIDCKRLKGKSVETIHKVWNKVAAESIHRQPSIVFLDDLDTVASAPVMEHEGDPEDKNTIRIIEGLISTFHIISEMGAKVMLMATSQSWKALHPMLVTSRGHHLFQEIVEILPPNLSTREDILKALLLSKPHLSSETMNNVSISKLATITEGYNPQDLCTLIDRATHTAWIRIAGSNSPINAEIVLTEEDFEIAINGFTPAALHGLKLHQSGTKGLKNVGGLSSAKLVVKETLMWPAKYPSLFASCPLRPQMSISLFGAPGTGKTLLAEAVAHECGLNYISIKGPELLSKYIGGSEQAIRDVFQRAQRAKPCILFFDEFDAIAPRRGHDNTGVTDRVVNQILTQMDGVEGLQGVYVLAATSRPDLLDPALLRPGRFDKCLHCPLPNKQERLEILQIHGQHLSLAADVDFEQLANATPYFSGADLQALLYNAQLEALHDDPRYQLRMETTLKEKVSAASGDGLIDESEMAKIMAHRRQRRKSSALILTDDVVFFPSVSEGSVELNLEETKEILKEVSVIRDNLMNNGMMTTQSRRRHSTISIAVSMSHLMKVVDKMKPSVAEAERRRYDRIYEAFTRSRGGDFSVAESIALSGKKRVTLA